MPRILQLTVPAAHTDGLLRELRERKGVLGITLQRGISVRPAGDVITLQILNRESSNILKLLDERGIGTTVSTAVMSSEPASYASPEAAPSVPNDSSDSSWEEIEQMLAKESHLTPNTAGIMFVAGFCAAAGIATGALHVVIGAMVIAPGFEPLVRVALGVVTGSRAWRRGALSLLGGYFALMLGAAAASALLAGTGTPLLDGSDAYESSSVLAKYWSTFTVGSLSVSLVAGVAGTLLVISHRSVLTAGVMIALALVPAAALVAVATVAGDMSLVRDAALRWAVELVIVLATATAAFLWKRQRGGRRRMLL